MKSRRRLLAWMLALYFAGLGWGYLRLPAAAIMGLADYGAIVSGCPVTFDNIEVSSAQRWYLTHGLNESPVPVVPRVSVVVSWNALVLARVRASHYVGRHGAEYEDSLYVSLFGAWIPVFTFEHVMA